MAGAFEWLATVSAALFAGGALYVSVVEHPARMRAGPAVAIAEFRLSYRRATPWQAGAAAACLVSGVLAAWLASDLGWALGALATGAVIPYTFLAMMRTNRRLLAGGPLPDGEVVALLSRWARLHWVRTLLGTLGLLVLVSRAVAR